MHGVTNTIDARARLLKAVLLGGLTAGVLDIADALIFHGARGVAPWRILQAIASGLLGREAFAGGAWTAALGLGLHFFIATTAAAVYALASLRLPVLDPAALSCAAQPLAWSSTSVMQYVVLPLSAFRPGPPVRRRARLTGGWSTCCWRTCSASASRSP